LNLMEGSAPEFARIGVRHSSSSAPAQYSFGYQLVGYYYTEIVLQVKKKVKSKISNERELQ